MSSPRQAQGSTLLLTRLARVVYRASTEEALGIPVKQYSVLRELRDAGGSVGQRALGERLHFDPNILVLLLNDIEDAGLALRRRDPSDRRRHIVEMTPAGAVAIERAEKAVENVEDEVLAELSDRERADLHRLLTKALGARRASPIRPGRRQPATAEPAGRA